MSAVIQFDHVSKLYYLGSKRAYLRYLLPRKPNPVSYLDEGGNDENIWALRDFSFDVEAGEALGLIGPNGAGKTTTLSILAGITQPTRGNVFIKGRVGALIQLGAGFHPELTGRENIYLNGVIMGLSIKQINKIIGEIIQFSELAKFIDTPIKRYSSGMYLRLAFAVAAHLEPEILVVDEVLAVGDAEFQRKCLGKMNDVAQQGRTVLFVSHNMSAILRLTQEALVLKKGQLIKRAPTPEAVDFYLASGQAETGERIWDRDDIRADAAPFTPVALRIKDKTGKIVDTVRSTEPITIEWEYQLDAPITGLRLGLYLNTMRGEYVFTTFDTDDAKQFDQFGARQAGRYVSRCVVPADFFNEGRYYLGVNASSFGVKRYFMDENAISFNVDISGAPGTQWRELRQGPIRPRLNWQIEKLG